MMVILGSKELTVILRTFKNLNGDPKSYLERLIGIKRHLGTFKDIRT